MSEYKLLVVDVDGTIVDSNGAISYEDEKALTGVAAAGITVSLSTGRIIKACQKIIDRLSLDGHHIFFDGALVSDPSQEEEIYCRPIERRLVKQAVDFARANDIYLELYNATGFFAERRNWSDKIHYDFFGVESIITDFNDIWQRERIIKAEMVVRELGERQQLELFKKEFEGKLRFSIARSPAFPNIDFINIINPDVSKGEALRCLVTFLGLTMNEVIAIGDGLNDISLLEAAGLAVAMGNAFPEVKRVADYITLDVGQNGVAAAVREFLG
ncbi:MAG: HAD family phosphatase [Dehalococcoidia bacterium]|nr:MAG: HAD family phosphatase [Dehalococcoidia bacterium]